MLAIGQAMLISFQKTLLAKHLAGIPAKEANFQRAISRIKSLKKARNHKKAIDLAGKGSDGGFQSCSRSRSQPVGMMNRKHTHLVKDKKGKNKMLESELYDQLKLENFRVIFHQRIKKQNRKLKSKAQYHFSLIGEIFIPSTSLFQNFNE